MAIGAPNGALCDLLFQRLKSDRRAHHCTYAGDLHSSNVIELEDDRIRQATVDTRVIPQVVCDKASIDCALLKAPTPEHLSKRRSIARVIPCVEFVLTRATIMLQTTLLRSRRAKAPTECHSRQREHCFMGLSYAETVPASWHVRTYYSQRSVARTLGFADRGPPVDSCAPGGSRTPIVPLRRRMPYPLDHGRPYRPLPGIGMVPQDAARVRPVGRTHRDDRI